MNKPAILIALIVTTLSVTLAVAHNNKLDQEPHRGSYVHQEQDNPDTSNDESNDQPLGLYGTETVLACTPHNDRCYTLDALIEDQAIKKLYFPKGGYIRFTNNTCLPRTVCNLNDGRGKACLLYTSPSPRDRQKSRMPSSA